MRGMLALAGGRPATSFARVYSDKYGNKSYAYHKTPSPASQIKNLNSLGQYEAAKSVWKKLKEDGADADTYTFASILATYRQLNDLGAEVLEIIDEISKKNIVNSYVTNQIVDIYSRRGELDDALASYDALVNSNSVVMAYSFFSLFEALVSAKRFGEARRLVDGSRHLFEALDQKFYFRLCSVASQSDLCQESFCFVMDCVLQFKNRVVSDSVAASGILNNFLRFSPHAHGPLDQQYHTFVDALKSQGTFGYSILLSHYSIRGDLKSMLSLWEEMNQKNVTRTHNMYGYLISTCASCCEVAPLENALSEMENESISLTPMILATLVRFYASHVNPEKTAEYFELLLAKGFVMPFLFNVLIELYTELLMKDRIEHVISVMKERHVHFNTAIYNSLMNYHILVGSPQESISLFEEMEQSLSKPNFKTYKLLALAYSAQNDREQVSQTLLKIREKFHEKSALLALCQQLGTEPPEGSVDREESP